MPTSSPSFTRWPREASVWCSCGEPTKIDVATAEALSRTASRIEVVCTSSEMSSFRMLAPPETRRTNGTSAEGSRQFRRTPRVSMTASVYGRRGSIVFRGFSRRRVGPMK